MKKIIAAAVLATAFIGAQAYAVDGTIFMTGGVRTHQVGSINSVVFGSNWETLGVPTPTGDYSAVAADTPVALTNFSYNVNTLDITSPSSAPFQLWSFVFGGNTYSFDLNGPLTGAASSNNAFIVSGTGTAFINGGSASDATWSLQTTSGGGFRFTATASTSAIPEPTIVGLLAIGSVLVIASRRKHSAH